MFQKLFLVRNYILKRTNSSIFCASETWNLLMKCVSCAPIDPASQKRGPRHKNWVMPTTCSFDTREGHLGITLSTSSVCTGANVDAVHPKDLCALSGIKQGFVIRSVNGSDISGHEHCMEMLEECKSKGEKVSITCLSVAEAKEAGAEESAITKKWVIRGCLVFFALLALLAAAIVSGKLPELLGLNLTKAAPTANSLGGLNDPELKNMMPGLEGMMNNPEMIKMREMMNNPEMKAMLDGIKDMKPPSDQ